MRERVPDDHHNHTQHIQRRQKAAKRAAPNRHGEAPFLVGSALFNWQRRNEKKNTFNFISRSTWPLLLLDDTSDMVKSSQSHMYISGIVELVRLDVRGLSKTYICGIRFSIFLVCLFCSALGYRCVFAGFRLDWLARSLGLRRL